MMLVVVAPSREARLSGVILRRSTEAVGRIQVCRVARFALGKKEHYFVEALYLTTCSVPGYCRVEYEKLEPLGDDFVLERNSFVRQRIHAMLQYT